MNILVTGFDPFGGAAVNPSWEAVCLLPDTVDGCQVHRLQLPTIFGECGRLLREKTEALRADMVVLCGVAQSRDAVTPELVAINYRMGSIPDNAGKLFSGEKIDPAAPDAYMTQLPVQQMVAALKEKGIPAHLSFSAGAYVCNDLYFAALDGGLPAVFLHVPGQEVLSAQQAASAIEICIRTALHTL